MPLFSSRRDPSPEPVYEPEPPADQPPKKHGLFHRNRSDASPASTHRTGSAASSAAGADPRYSTANSNYPTNNSNTGGSGIFRRSTDSSGGRRRSLFHRNSGAGSGSIGHIRESLDPSILQARERVMHAETAEMEADRALGEARLRVREAKEHVWRLEEEAKEEARRAKIKQQQAREVSKRGKGLGRHGV